MARRRKTLPQHEEGLPVTTEMPLLPVRDMVLFPHVLTPLFVGRERSVKAVEEGVARERTICIVAQRDPTVHEVGYADVYSVGTEAVVGRVLKMPDGTTSMLVQGQRRVRILGFTQMDPLIKARVAPIDEVVETGTSIEALMR